MPHYEKQNIEIVLNLSNKYYLKKYKRDLNTESKAMMLKPISTKHSTEKNPNKQK